MSKTKIPCSELPWGQLPSPPPFRAQQSLLLFCRALQKCLPGWVRGGLPGNSVTAFGPTKQRAKMPLLGPHSSFHILWGLPLIHVPLDTVFFSIRGSQKTLGWQGPLGGRFFVQSPAWSFTSRSSCSRSGPAELLKISKRSHRNLGHLFQCLKTFTGKFKSLSSLPTFMVCPFLSSVSASHQALHMQAFQRCFDVISPGILLGLWYLSLQQEQFQGTAPAPPFYKSELFTVPQEKVCFRKSGGQSTESTISCREAWIY